MFLWYSKAQMCYAYLKDVPAVKASDGLSAAFEESILRKSRWFTRGWTLQELLAPELVTFYSQDWHEIGTKRTLSTLLVSITGVRYEILVGSTPISDACIAERMAWASRRVTSRIEDIAYCLLGIFGVNIPPLYGEGQNAFLRLQQEIIRQTNDETIFAWTTDAGDTSDFQGGLLASSPAAFRYSGTVRKSNFDQNRPPFQMTNKGLCLDLILFLPGEDSEDYFEAGDLIAVLNCSRNNDEDLLALFLENIHSEQYRRSKPELLPVWGRGMGRKVGRKVVYVQQPNASYQAFRKEFCTLVLKINCLGFADEKADIAVDLARTYKSGGGRRKGNIYLIGGHEKVLQYTLKANNDGRIYFACWIDSFFILLNFSERPFGANIATTTYDFGTVDHFTELGAQSSDLQCCTFDRLSRVLTSGWSVSLKFRTGAATGSAGADIPHFIVHVTLDSKGRMPWPDPNEIQPEVERGVGIDKLQSKLMRRAQRRYLENGNTTTGVDILSLLPLI
jgi:hypothetical protein